MKEWGGARALRTDRGERLAVRRSPTRFRCGFFGPLQLHARRSGRCACGGVVPITLTVARNCARAKLERQRHRSTPGAAKCDFSPSDAEHWLRGCRPSSAARSAHSALPPPPLLLLLFPVFATAANHGSQARRVFAVGLRQATQGASRPLQLSRPFSPAALHHHVALVAFALRP
jgi:hypothetical protein